MAGAVDTNDFEKPILELQRRIEELSGFGAQPGRERELAKLGARLRKTQEEIYARLTPWQTTLVARHPKRPYTADYIQALFTEFVEIHGDRKFAEDPAILGGFALFHGEPVAVIGHQKGRDTREKVRRNFGMPRPEGYRKALRIMKLAEKFHRPVLTLIDTPGAYPGIGAEERGQAEAIAVNLREMARLDTPVLVTITGEGGSGGALALGVGDRILILAHSTYSVISPEGCAAILWKSDEKKQDAAKALHLTSAHMQKLGIVDEVVPEPTGAAHSQPEQMYEILDEALVRNLAMASAMSSEERLRARYDKFRAIGSIRRI
ncbi:MAG: acetyl-CoA carboxylase carboxyltransferase subunit alpha [Acidobacteriota bacterium]